MGKHIVLATFGSLGDLNPILAIARELARRGHYPVIATAATYRKKIEEEGVGFHAVRPDFSSPNESDELLRRILDPIRGPRYLYRTLLSAGLRESYHDLFEASRNADLLVSYPTTLAMPLVAEKLGKRWVSLHTWPASLPSDYDISYMPCSPMIPALHRI